MLTFTWFLFLEKWLLIILWRVIFSIVDPKGNPEERSEKGQFFFERSTLEKNKAKKEKA